MGDRIAVLISAALFALHPAQTESVAWVTVPDPLMALAVLISVLFYLKFAADIGFANHRSEPKPGRKSRDAKPAAAITTPSILWLLGSAAACLAALLVKQTAVILAPVLFVLALVIRARQPGATRAANSKQSPLLYALRPSLPFFLVTILYFGLRFNALGGKLAPDTQHLALKTVLLSMPATLWFYWKVLFWPLRLHAFADSTPTDMFSVHGVLLPGLALGLTVALLAWMLVWAWKKAQRELPCRETVRIHYALLLGALLLVVPILPALNLNALSPGDFLHGRYTYLPLVGLTLLFAAAWRLASWRMYILWAAALLVVAFTLLTVRQETAWKDDLTIFTLAHQIAPHNGPVALNLAHAHVQMAVELGESGRCNEAVPVFEEVIRHTPKIGLDGRDLATALSGLMIWRGQNNASTALPTFPIGPKYLNSGMKCVPEWKELRHLHPTNGQKSTIANLFGAPSVLLRNRPTWLSLLEQPVCKPVCVRVSKIISRETTRVHVRT